MREKLFARIEREYGITPDYPFQLDDVTAVFRLEMRGKWFAIFMRVSGEKLGFPDCAERDVVNVKCNPDEASFLHSADGILPAYHMNKTHWITVLLDGSVSENMAFALLENSYALVAEKAARRQKR